MQRKRIVIMGAAGRDFHNFNVCYRDNPGVEVVAFTATQIPFIQERTYPPELSGPLYPGGIPIHAEEKLPELIEKLGVDAVVFSYSDVAHEYVMHRASLAIALGPDFVLLGSGRTMLKSKKPVISVCAVRTGCGKSAVTRLVCGLLKEAGKKTVAVRHPMPYGDLARQRVQRFTGVKDMEEAACTIEEMEEYEHLVDRGVIVYAGVDYAEILRRAEREADIIVWDGGNNDLPFYRPDLEIVLTDPMRPGHELAFHPGEANLRRADCVIINKINTARPEDVDIVYKNINKTNTSAIIIKTSSEVITENPEAVRGRRVLVIEDGPTLTHGGMTEGAGIVAAREAGAIPVDPRPHAAGSIKETLAKYPALTNLVPAMGYSAGQIKDLENTINSTPADAVLIATPIDLARRIAINKPSVRVSYEVRDTESPGLAGLVEGFLTKLR